MNLKIKDPVSALTHFIAMLMAMLSSTPLLIKASKHPEGIHLFSFSVFIASMILLYAASTLHHTLDLSDKINRLFKKIDHLMIFVLIAGTYTPICIVALPKPLGIELLIFVWIIAAAGIIIKLLWVGCPKWLSSSLYIIMGWTCVLAFTQIINSLSTGAFIWLLSGGILYTVGGVIYALKLKVFNEKHRFFGSHEIFHLFVMAGSLCHFIVMYYYVADMPLVIL